jgi:hypothetical protein
MERSTPKSNGKKPGKSLTKTRRSTTMKTEKLSTFGYRKLIIAIRNCDEEVKEALYKELSKI